MTHAAVFRSLARTRDRVRLRIVVPAAPPGGVQESPDVQVHTRLRHRWAELYDRTVDELGARPVAQPRLRALRQLGTVIDRLEPT